jgi:hypothetical protein
MKKIKSSGGLSLLLMLTLLAPIAVIAQTTPPADEPVSSAPADPGTDAAAGTGTPQPTETPVAPEPPPAMEQAAPAAATADTPSHFEALPKPFFKHPFFMLLVFIVVVALVVVVVRRRKAK